MLQLTGPCTSKIDSGLMGMRRTAIRSYLFPIIVLLVGFGLRVHRLGAANVWWDEAFSIWMARKPLANLMETTAFDTHPPLYYILLHSWMPLTGSTEFAVRTISVMAGLLTIAVVYTLGMRLLGRRWALLGALLLAISRFHIWWSQEVRMYALAVLWITLALAIVIRQASTQNRRHLFGWAAYAIFLSAALHTLYLAGLAAVVAGITVLVLWAARRMNWRDVISFALANLGAILIYLPWILYALPRIRKGAIDADFSPEGVIALYMLLLSTGISTEYERYSAIIVVYSLIMCGTLIWLAVRRQWDAIAILAPALLIPPLVIYQFNWLQWRFFSPAPAARYFLLFAPVCMVIPVAGAKLLGQWRRWAGTILAVSMVGLAIWTWPPYYANRYLRDEWKTATRIIEAYAKPGDVVVLVSGDRYPLFLYEYDQLDDPKPTVALVPEGIPALTEETVDTQMQRAVSAASRVWFVEIETGIQDPERLARDWIDAYSIPVMSSAFDHNRLTLFALDGLPPTLSPTVSRKPGLELVLHEFRPGDTVHLGAYFSSSVIKMIHESGLVVSERTVSSPEGAILRHDITFPVTQATPRGKYLLEATDGQHIALVVSHSDPLLREQDIPNPLNARLGDIVELLGYQITPRNPRPGDTFTVDLYWRANGSINTSFTVTTQIIGPFNPTNNSPLWGQHDGVPVSGTFPTNEWPASLIIRDRHTLTFDADATTGEYRLVVGLYDPHTGNRLQISGTADDTILLAILYVP